MDTVTFKIDRLPPCSKCKENVSINESTLCYKCFRVYGGSIPKPGPDGSINTFGIELECFGEDLDPAGYSVGDGSVSCDWGDDYEFHLCERYANIHTTAINLCQRLKSLGAGVNASCGMHVHFSVPPMNKIRDFLRDSFRKIEPDLQKVFGVRFPSTYVYKINDDLRRDGWYNYRSNRVRERRTVEIRLHESTLNPYVMYDWLCTVREIQKVTHDLSKDKTTIRTKALQEGNLLGIMRTRAARRYVGTRLEDTTNKLSLEEYSF
jgi:hypothetical protein